MSDDLIKALQDELREADERVLELEHQAAMNGRLLTENAELRERIAELEAALKPFTAEIVPRYYFLGREIVFATPKELVAARKALEKGDE